jgi:hypothetical protein
MVVREQRERGQPRDERGALFKKGIKIYNEQQ